MATRQGNLVDNFDGTWTATWTGLTDADSDVGTAVGVGRFGMLMVQAIGDFDASGEITMEISNDGETWATALDPAGADVVLAADGAMAQIAGNPSFIRPTVTGGTSVDMDVLVNCSYSTTGANLIVQGTLTDLVNRLVDFQERSVVTATAAIMSNGLDVFTVSGGPIRIMDLFSFCESVNDATASTMQWRADGSATGQAATTFSGASASLANFAAGGVVYNNFTTLATAPVITQTAGVFLWGPTTSTGGGVVVPAGVIDLVIGVGSTTGTWRHYMRYVPLHPDATVTAAF